MGVQKNFCHALDLPALEYLTCREKEGRQT